MNQVDVTNDIAAPVPTGNAATERTSPSSWDPHDVWQTRIKLPREHAVRRAQARVGSAGHLEPL